MGRSHFDEEVLSWLRSLPLARVLDALGFFYRRDEAFKPEKDARTIRLFVSTPQGQAWELLVTGVKWYDSRAAVGGGGAIDLVMHLRRVDFVEAVTLLKAVHAAFRRPA
jgi:hypothetical protein